jgi:hypothetical protein
MIIGNENDRPAKPKRKVANKFNVLWFKDYDGTTTMKVVTRNQHNRIAGSAIVSWDLELDLV